MVVIAGVGMLATGAGLTGRQTIWPEFARLIPESPVIGIGYTGIRNEGGLVALSGDAHNILLDEMVRFGIVGFLALMAFLAIVVWLSFRAANQGFTLGAAVFATYFVASLTDVQNGWLDLSYHSFLIVMGALAAGVWLSDRKPVRA
jgi:O-antigen ligase